MKASEMQMSKPQSKSRNQNQQNQQRQGNGNGNGNGNSQPQSQSDSQGYRPSSEQPTHEQIAAKAYELYLESGCEEGRDGENWLRAEQLLSKTGGARQNVSAGSRTGGQPQAGSQSRSGQ